MVSKWYYELPYSFEVNGIKIRTDENSAEAARQYLLDAVADLIIPFRLVMVDKVNIFACPELRRRIVWNIGGVEIPIVFVVECGTTTCFEYAKIDVSSGNSLYPLLKQVIEELIRETVDELLAYWYDGLHTAWIFRNGAPTQRVVLNASNCDIPEMWRNECQDAEAVFEVPLDLLRKKLERAITSKGIRIVEVSNRIHRELEKMIEELEKQMKEELSRELELEL